MASLSQKEKAKMALKKKKNEEKLSKKAVTPSTSAIKYVSPLNRLCNSIRPNTDHQMSHEEGDTSYCSPVNIAFPTTKESTSAKPVARPLISLENGLNDNPPLPAGSPPKDHSGDSDLGNFQNFMKTGLLSLGKDIADSFANSIAGLDNSIRGGFNSLRDRLDDGCYQEDEEGELHEEEDDDVDHVDQVIVNQPEKTTVLPSSKMTAGDQR